MISVMPLFAVVLGLSLVSSEPPRGLHLHASSTARIVVIAGLTFVCAVFVANMATRAAFENPSPETSPARAASSMSASAFWGADARLAYLSALHLGYASAGNAAIANNRLDLRAVERAVRLDRRMPAYPLEMARTLIYYRQPTEATEAAFHEALARYPASPEGQRRVCAVPCPGRRADEAQRHLAIAEAMDDLSAGRRLAIEATKEILATPK